MAQDGSTTGCRGMGVFDSHDQARTAAVSCDSGLYAGASLDTANPSLFFQSAAGASPQASNPAYDWQAHDFATGLENRMATFQPPANYDGNGVYGTGGTSPTVFKAKCWYFKNTGAAAFGATASGLTSATRTAKQQYLQFGVGATLTNHMIKHPSNWQVYTMKAGVQPYEGTATGSGAILASQTVWPGINSIGVASISMDKFKDETAGDSDYTHVYHLNVVSYPVNLQPLTTATGTAADTFTNPLSTDTVTLTTSKETVLYSIFAFTITDFLVREVTIRDYRGSEYWSAIGGLYGGSVLIIALFFTATALKDPKTARPVQLFNYLCPKQQEEWLAPYQSDDKNKAAAEETTPPAEKNPAVDDEGLRKRNTDNTATEGEASNQL